MIIGRYVSFVFMFCIAYKTELNFLGESLRNSPLIFKKMEQKEIRVGNWIKKKLKCIQHQKADITKLTDKLYT